MSNRSQGQIDYENDVKKCPRYHTGKIRKTWDQLGDAEQWSWNKPQNK